MEDCIIYISEMTFFLNVMCTNWIDKFENFVSRLDPLPSPEIKALNKSLRNNGVNLQADNTMCIHIVI